MRTLLVLVALLPVAAALTPATIAAPPPFYTYSGPGTIVLTAPLAATGVPTIADNGAVVCRDANADGIPESGRGGVCIPFAALGGQDSLHVQDASVPDQNLAFQVCVDLNGDGICGGPGTGGPAALPCSDIIHFSHDTATGFTVNPLNVATAQAQNAFTTCAGMTPPGSVGFPGFIVILCAGIQADPFGAAGTHTHHVTSGRVTPTFGAPFSHGDFCGAPAAAKAYTVVTGV